jgi:hypothetical protein
MQAHGFSSSGQCWCEDLFLRRAPTPFFPKPPEEFRRKQLHTSSQVETLFSFFHTPPFPKKNKISLLLYQRIRLPERLPLPHMRAQARRGYQEPGRLSLRRGAHQQLGVFDDRASQRRVLRHGEVTQKHLKERRKRSESTRQQLFTEALLSE